jgi:hypothetical protein
MRVSKPALLNSLVMIVENPSCEKARVDGEWGGVEDVRI